MISMPRVDGLLVMICNVLIVIARILLVVAEKYVGTSTELMNCRTILVQVIDDLNNNLFKQ